MLPDLMRCVEITQAGAPEVLKLTQRPLPTLKPNEVLIKVRAAGINRPDVLQRKGLYLPPADASDLPGLEVAGEIIAVHPDVTQWQVGDAVCALTHGGGYAEYCTTDAGQCLPIPKGLDWIQAAALPETFFTVWSNVFQRGQLKPGETLLIQGGAGGIGTTAILLASTLGYRVFATAGTEEKCQLCEELGAVRGINYKTEDFVEIIKKETEGRGVDVILDIIAGDYLPREIKILADDGRLVLIAFLGGAKANVNFAEVMLRRLTITGSTLRPRSNAIKAEIAQGLREHVWRYLDRGLIKPLIYTTFPLEEAALAHALMESGDHAGKIVLTVSA